MKDPQKESDGAGKKMTHSHFHIFILTAIKIALCGLIFIMLRLYLSNNKYRQEPNIIFTSILSIYPLSIQK